MTDGLWIGYEWVTSLRFYGFLNLFTTSAEPIKSHCVGS